MLVGHMDASTVVIALTGVAAAGIVGAAFGARRSRARIVAAEREAAEARDALDRREVVAREQRAVQDLILDTMQEGILLLDAELDTAFANAALERHLGSRPASASQLFPLALREAVGAVARTSETTT